MGPPYHYFDLAPAQEEDAYPLTEALQIIRERFTHLEEAESEALADAQKRQQSLARFGAPRSILELYEDPKVTRIRITEPEAGGYFIEFDLWDKQGVMVYPRPDEARLEVCQELAQKLADALGYTLTVEEYD